MMEPTQPTQTQPAWFAKKKIAKAKTERRGRGRTVSVTGIKRAIFRWLASEAAANERSVDGQIRYIVRQAWMSAQSSHRHPADLALPAPEEGHFEYTCGDDT